MLQSGAAVNVTAAGTEKAQQLQNRLYFILEKLQAMAAELPSYVSRPKFSNNE